MLATETPSVAGSGGLGGRLKSGTSDGWGFESIWSEGRPVKIGKKGRGPAGATEGETMSIRGRVTRLSFFFILAFACLGFAGSQVLKQRRTLAATLAEKDYQLHSIENDLKEQVSIARERQEERDFAQKQVIELERVSQSALDSLRARERDLADMRKHHHKAADEVVELKRVVDQKEGEIVYVRGKLQEYSFERAKESSEQLHGSGEPKKRQQEEEHVDEGDRVRIQEDESARDATEREMDERSKPQGAANASGLDLAGKKGDSLKPDIITRDPDEREMDVGQVVDLHEVTKLEADLQSGEDQHEEAVVRIADEK